MSRFSPWRRLTDAQILRPRGLKLAARHAGATLIGVVGFSGSWRNNPRREAADTVARALRAWFARKRPEENRTIWCVSGATDLGVPAIAYRVADELGLRCVGVTPAAAMSHPLARLDYLVPIGKRFGDESRVFVELCDELWMFGGGPQSESEVRLATQMGKPIVVAQGVGGTADLLTKRDLPTATFITL
ncbi:MAG: hypothetical protein AAGA56_02230 [Myxococcota bacterium]